MEQNSNSLISNYKKEVLRKTKEIFGGSISSPFMKIREIELFSEILENTQPAKVLEYGCGYSTLVFPKHLKEGAKWIAIEHNKKWFQNIHQGTLDMHNTEVYHVDPETSKWEKEDDEKSFASFINFPEKLAPFDLILVDGVARNACARKAKSLLSENGLLIVHDCNREIYHEEVKSFPHWMILEDYRKTAGGFGFASKSKRIEDFFDIEKHKKVWQLDSDIHNFFKFKFIVGKSGKPFSIRSSKNTKIPAGSEF